MGSRPCAGCTPLVRARARARGQSAREHLPRPRARAPQASRRPSPTPSRRGTRRTQRRTTTRTWAAPRRSAQTMRALGGGGGGLPVAARAPGAEVTTQVRARPRPPRAPPHLGSAPPPPRPRARAGPVDALPAQGGLAAARGPAVARRRPLRARAAAAAQRRAAAPAVLAPRAGVVLCRWTASAPPCSRWACPRRTGRSRRSWRPASPRALQTRSRREPARGARRSDAHARAQGRGARALRVDRARGEGVSVADLAARSGLRRPRSPAAAAAAAAGAAGRRPAGGARGLPGLLHRAGLRQARPRSPRFEAYLAGPSAAASWTAALLRGLAGGVGRAGDPQRPRPPRRHPCEPEGACSVAAHWHVSAQGPKSYHRATSNLSWGASNPSDMQWT